MPSSESGNDSSNESGLGPRTANASGQPRVARVPRQPSLFPRTIELMIHGWDRDNYHPGYPEYSLHRGSESVTDNRVPRAISTRRDSVTSSMELGTSSRSPSETSPTPSSRLRTLGSTSTLSYAPSAHTSRVSSLYQRSLLEEDEQGVLHQPSQQQESGLACACHFLNCRDLFSDLGEWDLHTRTIHFRHILPTNIHCPFQACPAVFHADSGNEAWTARNAHIASSHSFAEEVDTTNRADSSLSRHLWANRLITEPQYQELRKFGRLGETDQPYVMTTEPRRERRTVNNPARRRGDR
ncbi:hypothetical protein MBLNU230_g8321t1 [Neophaeotheca triangularis]